MSDDEEQRSETPWMTPAEAVAYVRCSVRTLEGYRRSGGGPVYHRQNQRTVVYHRADLDEWRGRGRATNTTQERLDGIL
ncbi:MAG: helix-turn-helix domain-containing protein [Vitreimonas sp.]